MSSPSEKEMKYRLMDLLACPICKNYPLKLYVIKKEKGTGETREIKTRCELYCAYHNIKLPTEKRIDCAECQKIEILEGVIQCQKCGRWYPIIEGIPRMLPDKMRNKEDLKFLEKYRDKLPDEIVKQGKPCHL